MIHASPNAFDLFASIHDKRPLAGAAPLASEPSAERSFLR